MSSLLRMRSQAVCQCPLLTRFAILVAVCCSVISISTAQNTNHALYSVSSVSAVASGALSTLVSSPSNGTTRGVASNRRVFIQARDATSVALTTGGDTYIAWLESHAPSCQVTSATVQCSPQCAPLVSPHSVSAACQSLVSRRYAVTPGVYYVPATVTDQADGTYRVFYQPEAASVYDLYVSQLLSGGLRGQYYDNVWFLNSPSVDRIDSAINFDWGSGLITPYSSQYVSIRWKGVLQSQLTEQFTLYGYADDWIRVWLDNQLIVDAWNVQCCNETWGNVNLQAGFNHALQVEVVQLRGASAARLSWSSPSTLKQIIPQSALFHTVSIAQSPFTAIDIAAANPPSSAFSYIVPSTGTSRAVAGNDTSFIVTAQDEWSNTPIVNSSLADWSVTLTNDATSAQVTSPYAAYLAYQTGGNYTVTYNVQQNGNYTLHVRLNGSDIVNSPLKLIVSNSVTSPAQTLASGPGLTTATSGVTSYFNLQLRDSFGNNRSSLAATFSDQVAVYLNSSALGVGLAGFTQPLADGSLLAFYTPTRSGAYQLRITVNGVQIPASPFAFVVQAGAISAKTCIFALNSGTGIVAGQAKTLSIIQRDLFNNTVTQANDASGFTATLTSSGITTVVMSSIANDNSTGNVTAYFTATRSGTYKLTVLYRGQNVSGSPVNVTVQPGAVSATNSLLQLTNTSLTAGQTSVASITPRDAYGNAIVGDLETFVAGVHCANSVSSTVTVVYDSTLQRYNASFALTQVASACYLNVTLSGVNVLGSPLALAIVAAPANAATAQIYTTGLTSLVAGVATSVGISSFDAFNNTLQRLGSQYSLVLTDQNDATNIKTVAFTNDVSGAISNATFTMTRASTYSSVLSLLQSGGLQATYYSDDAFGTPVLNRIETQVNQDFGFGTPSIGLVPADYFSLVYNGRLQAPMTSLYSLYLETSANLGVRLTLNGVVLIDQLSGLSGTSVYRTRVTLQGSVQNTIRIDVVALAGLASVVLSWSSPLLVKQTVPSSALWYAAQLNGSPFTTVVASAASNAAQSDYTLSVAGTTLISGQPLQVTVQLRDAFGNAQTSSVDQSASVAVQLTASSPVHIDTATVTQLSTGLYNATLVPSQSGTAQLTVKYASTNIKQSPLSLTTVVGALSPATSFVVAQASSINAGQPAVLLLYLRDATNNTINVDLLSSGLNTLSTVVTSTGGTSFAFSVSSFTNGIYTLSGMPQIADSYTIVVKLDGTAVTHSPVALTVRPQFAPDASQTTVTDNVYSAASGSSNAYLTSLRTVDSFGNAYSMGNNTQFVIRIKSQDPLLYNASIIKGVAVDQMNGSYVVLYNATVLPAGTYVATLNLTSSQGLSGNYYNNKYLYGAPVRQRIDSNIDFNWVAPALITPSARRQVSVSWLGYVRCDVAGQYNFSLVSDDGSRLFVDGIEIIDQWRAGSQLNTAYGATHLNQTVLYDIRVDYRQTEDTSSIQLLWLRPDSASFQVVPQSFLYAQSVSIPQSPLTFSVV